MRTPTFFLLIALLPFLNACTQLNKITKGHAYSRQVLTGAPPRTVIDENNNTTTRPRAAGVEYFIYAELKDTMPITVSNIWIKGNAFDGGEVKRVELPVVVNNGYGHPASIPDSLITGSAINVWQIEVGKIKQEQPSQKVREAQKENEVVIEYITGDKTLYYPIKKLQTIKPLALQ